MRVVFGVISIAAISVAASARPPATSPTPGGNESLGNQLLDDLSPEINRPPARRGSTTKPSHALAPSDIFAPDPDSGAHPRFDDLGEDIGAPSGPLSLTRVQQGMQRAENLLANPGAASNAGLVQKQVVAQLDALIEELSKQCQACQQASQSSQTKPGQGSKPKPGKPKTVMGRGSTAARDSTDRLDQSNAQAVDKGDMTDLVKRLWGHLPERRRQQMMQSYSNEFLPKYELEIEQYYRRLSEENVPPPAEE